eukprot:gene28860-34830_t
MVCLDFLETPWLSDDNVQTILCALVADRRTTREFCLEVLMVDRKTIFVPLLYKLADIKAYVKLIEDSPESKVIRFDEGYHPRKRIVQAVCSHGGYTSSDTALPQDDACFAPIKATDDCWCVAVPLWRLLCYSIILTCLRLPELEFIDCSQNWEDMGQGTALAELIREHPSLKVILMGDNELATEEETAVVEAIRDAAGGGKLVLEDLDGLELNKENLRAVLGPPEECANMTNADILAHLKK